MNTTSASASTCATLPWPKVILWDSFNKVRISNHRTVQAAVMARIRHSARLNRNSPGSYVWYKITDMAGNPVNGDLILDAELAIES